MKGRLGVAAAIAATAIAVATGLVAPAAQANTAVTGRSFDGDGKTDLAVFRPGSGIWFVKRSSNGSEVSRQWGTAGDWPVPGDYDGDSLTDFAVWRPSSGIWFVINSSTGISISRQWGNSSDIPAP
jgi:hypothetical protein